MYCATVCCLKFNMWCMLFILRQRLRRVAYLFDERLCHSNNKCDEESRIIHTRDIECNTTNNDKEDCLKTGTVRADNTSETPFWR